MCRPRLMSMRRKSTVSERCDTCRFWSPTPWSGGEHPEGECRRKAPAPWYSVSSTDGCTFNGQVYWDTLLNPTWPATFDRDWCGEWQSLPAPATSREPEMGAQYGAMKVQPGYVFERVNVGDWPAHSELVFLDPGTGDRKSFCFYPESNPAIVRSFMPMTDEKP